MAFRPFPQGLSRIFCRKNLWPLIGAGLPLTAIFALALWFSSGLIFASGQRDSGSSGTLPVDNPAGQPAGLSPENPAKHSAGLPPELPAEQPSFRAAVIPEDPRPGEPLTVCLAVFPGAAGIAAEAGTAGPQYAVLVSEQGKRLSRAAFFTLGDELGEAGPAGVIVGAAVLAVPATAVPGKADIRLEPETGGVGKIPLNIGGRDFVSEEIDLDQGNTSIRTVPDPQKTTESEQLWAILNRSGDRIYAAGAFKAPVSATRRTSFFGDRRVYRYVNGSTDTAIHAGIDYGVPRGTAVSACAPGRVILARFRIVTGNSVILEHFPGGYSLYYHLDSIAVTEGALVEAGALLGESGATGLATGPHLHWEIRVAGENADPDAFIQRPVLDKAAIFSKLIP